MRSYFACYYSEAKREKSKTYLRRVSKALLYTGALHLHAVQCLCRTRMKRKKRTIRPLQYSSSVIESHAQKTELGEQTIPTALAVVRTQHQCKLQLARGLTPGPERICFKASYSLL